MGVLNSALADFLFSYLFYRTILILAESINSLYKSLLMSHKASLYSSYLINKFHNIISAIVISV